MRAIPSSWLPPLATERRKPYYSELIRFVDDERTRHVVFPPDDLVFRALDLTPLGNVRVVLLGQDPYHDDGQAHGLCFSVPAGTKPPPSLRNIFRELTSDIGVLPPPHGDLTAWAERGVLLLNTVLTVRAHEPASHAGRGWEQFTDAIIAAVNDQMRPIVFCLWGKHAQKKASAIDLSRHALVQTAHPSPLSAKKFLGSKPFSAANAALVERGEQPLDWRLPLSLPQPMRST